MANDAFAQGKLAYEHNHPMSSCDYPVGSSLRAEWMAGWTQAGNVRPARPSETMASLGADEAGNHRSHRL